jgi:23S rRNA pseudouridine2605 synthase
MEAARDPNLTKFLAMCGASSRRRAVELIRAGRVTVDGAVTTDPAFRVAPPHVVALDGKTVAPPDKFHYIMLNKPRGYVCSNSDAHAEHLALELITGFSGCFLRSAGRLDKDSEGLIVFSDDGEYLERVAHPRHRVTKLYDVTVSHPLSEKNLAAMRSGVVDEGELLRVLEVEQISPGRLRIKLNEGKKREIRRLCAGLGAPVVRLRRIALGGLALGDLATGAYRELSEREVALSLSQDPAAEI